MFIYMCTKQPHWEMNCWHFYKGKSCSLLKIKLFFSLQFITGLEIWSSPKLQIFVTIINIKDSTQTSLREKKSALFPVPTCYLYYSSTRSQARAQEPTVSHTEWPHSQYLNSFPCSMIDVTWMSTTCFHSVPFPTLHSSVPPAPWHTHRAFLSGITSRHPGENQPLQRVTGSMQAPRQAARQLWQGEDIMVCDTHIDIVNTSMDLNLSSHLHGRMFSFLQRC